MNRRDFLDRSIIEVYGDDRVVMLVAGLFVQDARGANEAGRIAVGEKTGIKILIPWPLQNRRIILHSPAS